jgi:WD40 repeat protein/serine/threonine protein kinase
MSTPSLVEDIFLAAVEKATPEERAAFLDEACRSDAELRRRVERLLAAYPKAGGFLEQPEAPLPAAGGATVDSAPGQPETADYGDPTARVGAILAGKYKLVEEIGEGGMGSVFMAQQTEPVKRAVAVKIIKAGMDSKAVLVRFEAERQALAMMDHPNIAKVLDAGTTDAGRPFFVMELVKGTPITRYCDEHKLTPRQRLELFVPVCQAIQHAHQKGIIHRDLKPSNVLVALYDDRPVPKVIDFGVAKAAGQALTEQTLMTGFGQIVGTPEYMSPEQASLNNLDIDTRSDVYSLGVLLYELLTGTTPVDKKSLGKAAVLEILRIVREVEAPRPSAKLSTSDTLPSVAANRGTEPAKLSRLLKGELDWLVLRALEKDRTRRYETANALSRDIQRYLADEVVEARPPSVGYRVSKFVRRHKGQVIAVSLVLLALLAGMAGTTLALFEARRQTTEKEAALEEATHHLDNSNFLLAVAAYDGRDIYQTRLRLDSIQAKHRGWEWHYLRRQSIGGIFTIATASVGGVAFSPDGTRIVTGNRVWDMQTGTPLLDLKGPTKYESMAFSPDGMRIVTGSRDGTAKVWDARTGAQQLELKGHTNCVNGVAFSPDGTRIVTGSGDGRALVWDARTGAQQLDLKGHTKEVWCVAFSPDPGVPGRIVTGSSDLTAKVWDARTGKLLLELKGHSRPVSGVAFSPDGARIVTGSHDGTAKVWDARTGTQQLNIKWSTGVKSVAFSPDGTRIVTGTNFGKAQVWDARTGTPQLGLMTGSKEVAFSPDGTRIVTGFGVWDAQIGTPQLVLKGHTEALRCVAFSPDGTRIVTGSDDQLALVWDRWTSTPQLKLKGHTGAVWGVAFSPDGTRIATASRDGTAKVWDAWTGTQQLELKGHSKTLNSVAYSPDGMRIITGSDDQGALVWDARTGTPQLKLEEPFGGGVTTVAFSPDGTQIVTASTDSPGGVHVWDARTGRLMLELIGGFRGLLWVSSVSFSPDGTRIVTGRAADQTAKVWDARAGTLLLELKGNSGAVAFSPDGTRIVTGNRVWDAQTGTPLLDLKGHTKHVSSVAFSPDGTRIVTASYDGTARLWDARPIGGVQPDEEELAYRRSQTQPDLSRYREAYETARAAQDDFAARFYLNLLPPAEQKMVKAQADADREIADGRTADALGQLVIVSAAKPGDTSLAIKLAALQAWFGHDKELADTCGRALESARGTFDPLKSGQLSRICCLRPTPERSRWEAALALARKAVEIAKEDPYTGSTVVRLLDLKLTLGMAEYRSGHFAEADAALLAVAKGPEKHYDMELAAGTANFYRAMSLFRQGKEVEAQKLATEAAAQMKPLPKDDKNPLAGGATADDLMLWLAYKEAKAMVHFDATPPKSENDKK